MPKIYRTKLIPNEGKPGSYTIQKFDENGNPIDYKKYLTNQQLSFKDLAAKLLQDINLQQ